MSWLPLSFAAPAVLIGLLALPAIWWLLRLTPPRPDREVFPPFAILARVVRTEETPHQSPWWLTLLRLLLAGLVILALAEPVFAPRERIVAGGGALALVIDNGWAAAPDWDMRVATAERLIGDAAGLPIILALSAGRSNEDIGPFDAETAIERLAAAEPQPVPTNRPDVYARVGAAIEPLADPTVAVLSDGLAAQGDENAFERLLGAAGRLVWIAPDRLDMVALTSVANEPEAVRVSAIRPQGEAGPVRVTLAAADDRGRRIAETDIVFAGEETEAVGQIRVPFELRNDFVSLTIDSQDHAGATRVLDESSRRRRVGLLSQAEADRAQPLLSPLYYIRRAMAPYADLVEPSTPDLARAIPELLERNPAMIVMADIGTLPDTAREDLVRWLNDGGTLVRFAGSRLVASGDEDTLLPVRLRLGERALGGALSWTEPQPLAAFPQDGPFADLTPPRDVVVARQVLAEPSSDIVDKTWASLADGTPLVTGAARGDGMVVLFHITPEATWSNLPISGSFVEMLRRIVQLSRNQGSVEASASAGPASLPPYRLISADGSLVPPTPDARPLATGTAAVTIENPPGLYGTEEGRVAHNLLGVEDRLDRLVEPPTALPVVEASYAFDQSHDLKGPLLAVALALLLLDALAVLWIGGLLRPRPRAAASRMAGMLAVTGCALVLLAGSGGTALAQDARPDDAEAIEAVSTTRLAYVVTGQSSVDSISRAGLAGLSRFLIEKTALEPGEPAGVDIASDELAFYPILYWAIDPAAAVPSAEAIARVDAYMQQGGTVLFDTRDQSSSWLQGAGATPATMRLREILDELNVPALEPVPDDHVLTKAFFILTDFPGRFSGSPLWVEASLDATSRQDRPVRTGDGVTPIMITANDFAGAWAVDADGNALLPTVPADPMQRIYAFRAGVNIIMYMLTGNYKSDQVHVPSILERLGQ